MCWTAQWWKGPRAWRINVFTESGATWEISAGLAVGQMALGMGQTSKPPVVLAKEHWQQHVGISSSFRVVAALAGFRLQEPLQTLIMKSQESSPPASNRGGWCVPLSTWPGKQDGFDQSCKFNPSKLEPESNLSLKKA